MNEQQQVAPKAPKPILGVVVKEGRTAGYRDPNTTPNNPLAALAAILPSVPKAPEEPAPTKEDVVPPASEATTAEAPAPSMSPAPAETSQAEPKPEKRERRERREKKGAKAPKRDAKKPSPVKAERGEPPKAPKGVSRDIVEFVHLATSPVVIPKEGKSYWFYKAGQGEFATAQLHVIFDEGAFYAKLVAVSGKEFEYLTHVVKANMTFALALLVNPTRMHNGVTKRRIMAFAKVLEDVAQRMERARARRPDRNPA